MQLDTLCDMVPVLRGMETSWTIDSTWYENDKSCLRLASTAQVDSIAFLYLRVLDYAAECSLKVYNPYHPYWNWYQLFPWKKIPLNFEQFRSSADPDSDGLTVWEEYRGFCDSTGGHFRLDTTAAVKRQIIVIDPENIPGSQLFSRLQEMMRCSLVVKNDVRTDIVDAGFMEDDSITPLEWDFYERLDTYQARWSSALNTWQINPYSDPLYYFPAPADSSGLERKSDQVAVRLGCYDRTDYHGECAHHSSGISNWGCGICGNAGIKFNFATIEEDLLRIWPLMAGEGSIFSSCTALCIQRCNAHEFGHTIEIDEHDPQNGGYNKMCVMLNVIIWARLNFPNYGDFPLDLAWWWNSFYHPFEDQPSIPNHKWGYMPDNFECESEIFYRPPFRQISNP